MHSVDTLDDCCGNPKRAVAASPTHAVVRGLEGENTGLVFK
jgi:hypothetical protein